MNSPYNEWVITRHETVLNVIGEIIEEGSASPIQDEVAKFRYQRDQYRPDNPEYAAYDDIILTLMNRISFANGGNND
jgi:hypothetical protein